MSLQQVAQPRSSANTSGRRRVDREMGGRMDNKSHSGKSASNFPTMNGSKVGGFEGPSRDRLVYLTSCLRGHHVEVQVKDGSIFSGIFHATNIGKDIGVVLKMALQTKDGSLRGQKAAAGFVSKAPSKTYIIHAKDLVQVIAKDISLTGDGLTNGLSQDKRQDLMIDSHISQSRIFEERELERWTPDKDDPQCPELENIFDDAWKRNWDQFKTNEALFGVKSTFDEELYTTKLERGPQMRELEREATRIAREIEGEETHDLHLAEERGLYCDDFDLDDDSRFSSVFRGVGDSQYEENDDKLLDEHNDERFEAPSGSSINQPSEVTRGKSIDGAIALPSCSPADGTSSQYPSKVDTSASVSSDHVRQVNLDSDSSIALDGEGRNNESQCREQSGGKSYTKDFTERKTISAGSQTSKSDEIQLPLNSKKASFDRGRLSPTATAYAPSSCVPSKGQEPADASRETSDIAVSGKDSNQLASSRIRPGSSTSSTSECVGVPSASSGPSLSPSSSMGSLSSEKSSLNPYAKEFKPNPNAKSFTPSLSSMRPPPLSEGPLYFSTAVSAVPHMHGVPVGIGPTFGGPPVIYNPPMAPVHSPQAYVHPNGPMYGQQMILGQPRPVIYMPGYPHLATLGPIFRVQ